MPDALSVIETTASYTLKGVYKVRTRA